MNKKKSNLFIIDNGGSMEDKTVVSCDGGTRFPIVCTIDFLFYLTQHFSPYFKMKMLLYA